jgi:hypothetical protein
VVEPLCLVSRNRHNQDLRKIIRIASVLNEPAHVVGFINHSNSRSKQLAPSRVALQCFSIIVYNIYSLAVPARGTFMPVGP